MTSVASTRGSVLTAPPTVGARTPRPLAAPTLALLALALGGRFTLDRAGLQGLAWVDLRLIGMLVALAFLAFEARWMHTGASGRRAEGWLVAATLFFLYQVGSALWAPELARAGEKALDVVVLAFLTIACYLHARPDPVVVARRVFWFFYASAGLFAVGGLFVSGAGAQGRYAAFGGGPNVFVRIEVLGIIFAVTLLSLGVSRWVLLPVPLLVVAAVLSGSRGGLAALVVVAVAAAMVSHGLARRRVLGGFVLAGVAVLVAYVSSLGSTLIQSRFVEQTLRQGYTSDRFDVWADTFRLAVEHPLLGAGLDGYYGLLGYRTGFDYPHNYLFAVIGEGGLLGLALFTAAALLWVRTVRTGPCRNTEGRALVAAAAYVAVASAFSGDYYDARLAWMFAALAAAVYTASAGPARPGPHA